MSWVYLLPTNDGVYYKGARTSFGLTHASPMLYLLALPFCVT